MQLDEHLAQVQQLRGMTVMELMRSTQADSPTLRSEQHRSCVHEEQMNSADMGGMRICVGCAGS